MKNLYICHCPKDIHAAKALQRATSALGACVIMSEAPDALHTCDLFVLVWSRRAWESADLRAEWTTAQIAKRRILPVLLDATPLPVSLQHLPVVQAGGFASMEEAAAQCHHALLNAAHFGRGKINRAAWR